MVLNLYAILCVYGILLYRLKVDTKRTLWIKNRIRILKNKYQKIQLTWLLLTFTWSSGRGPGVLSSNFFKSWSRYSKTSVNYLSVCSTFTSRTIFECWSSLSKAISLIAVLGIPSSSDSSLIALRAYISPVSTSFALWTIPYVPSPTYSSFSYLSIFDFIIFAIWFLGKNN